MIIRLARDKDFLQIAGLHKTYIPAGFLSSLGLAFLKIFYESLANSKHGFCMVAEADGRIIGFVSGATSTKKFYKEFFKKNFLKLAVILLPKIFNYIFIRKIIEDMFYCVKQRQDLPEAEQISIVVDKAYQGRWVAQKLSKKSAEEFKIRRINQYKTIISERLVLSYRFHEAIGWVLHSTIELHKGDKSRIYVFNI